MSETTFLEGLKVKDDDFQKLAVLVKEFFDRNTRAALLHQHPQTLSQCVKEIILHCQNEREIFLAGVLFGDTMRLAEQILGYPEEEQEDEEVTF